MCLLQNGVRCEKGPWTQSLQCQFAESDRPVENKARGVLLTARSGSLKSCGSAGKNQTLNLVSLPCSPCLPHSVLQKCRYPAVWQGQRTRHQAASIPVCPIHLWPDGGKQEGEIWLEVSLHSFVFVQALVCSECSSYMGIAVRCALSILGAVPGRILQQDRLVDVVKKTPRF